MTAVELAFREDLASVGSVLDGGMLTASQTYGEPVIDIDYSSFDDGTGSYSTSEAATAELVHNYHKHVSDAVDSYTGIADKPNVYFTDLPERVDGQTDLRPGGDIELDKQLLEGRSNTGESIVGVYDHEFGHVAQREIGKSYGFDAMTLANLTPLLEGQVSSELGQNVYQQLQKIYDRIMDFEPEELDGTELPIVKDEFTVSLGGFMELSIPWIETVDLGHTRRYLDDTQNAIQYIDSIRPPQELEQLGTQQPPMYGFDGVQF